jgi:hypothetical protein
MYKFNFFGGEKKSSDKKKNSEVENEKLTEEKNELKVENSDSQKPTEKGNSIDHEPHKENTIFAPELKPFAEKVLGLMEMGKSLQEICNNLFSKEKETATPEQIRMFDKAFAKFQTETYDLKIDQWHEELNNIVYNNEILIELPAGKENNRSLVYATVRQSINENSSEERRIEAFEKGISITLLNSYCGALLVLVEDMKVLAESKISIPKEIYELREMLRIQIIEKLGLKINDIALLENLNNNGDVEVIDEVVSSLTEGREQVYGNEQVVEVLSYGVGGYGGCRVDKTKVIVGK